MGIGHLTLQAGLGGKLPHPNPALNMEVIYSIYDNTKTSTEH